jgi:hypothetical protein
VDSGWSCDRSTMGAMVKDTIVFLKDEMALRNCGMQCLFIPVHLRVDLMLLEGRILSDFFFFCQFPW